MVLLSSTAVCAFGYRSPQRRVFINNPDFGYNKRIIVVPGNIYC